jgi:hypothetical protein
MSDTINADGLEDWMGEPLSEEHRKELEQINLQKREIKKQFDAWFEEMEGFSFRYERFWDDFDYAKESKNNQLMVKWLRTAFRVGYDACESKHYGGTD